jgi:hypothetical protein
MTWTQKDLENLQVRGLKIDDSYSPEIGEVKKPKIKIVKISIEKQTIELFLKQFKEKGLIDDYVTELQFDNVRKFRFDWAVPSLKIGIEYEGIMSAKSRHTTINGYSKDIEKYNLAITLGWRVIRYTAKNYKDLENDLNKLL